MELWHQAERRERAPLRDNKGRLMGSLFHFPRAGPLPLTSQMGRSINRFNELRQTNARCMAHCTMWREDNALLSGGDERRWRTPDTEAHEASLPLFYLHAHTHTRMHAQAQNTRSLIRTCQSEASGTEMLLSVCGGRWISEWWLTRAWSKSDNNDQTGLREPLCDGCKFQMKSLMGCTWLFLLFLYIKILQTRYNE